MPIEFAPPQPNFQGFNLQPPQSNALATLAQIAQMRNQNLQRQGLEMGLEKEQADMDSRRALIQSFVQGEGNYDKTFQIAVASGKVSPKDLMALKEHKLKMDTDTATLEKTELDNMLQQGNRYRSMLLGIPTKDRDPAAVQQDLAAMNQQATQMGLFKSKRISPFEQYTDADHLTAYANSLAMQEQLQKEASEAAQRKLLGVQTEEAQQKVTAGGRAQAIADLQTLPLDPKTKTPTPAAWSAFLRKYPNLVEKPVPGEEGAGMGLPQVPTADWMERFIRSGVAAEKQPEYDLKAMKARLGLMGDDKFDQYQLRYAQSLGKRPADLSFPEFQHLTQQYAKDTQNPELLAAVLALRGSQQVIAGAQAKSILTPDQIQSNATDLRKGDLSPDQIRELRAGKVNQGAQIIEAARAQAKAAGEPFSLFDLEQQATFREKTLQEFTSTLISHAGGQRMALNTLIHHADLYLDAAAALKNGTFKPGNEIYNKVRTMFGSAPPTNAALLARFFASETGKVATGGVPAEGEIHGILDSMSTSGSPEAMEGAGKTLIGIAAGRMIPLKELRDKARLEKYVDILGPDAKEILQRRGFDPETMKPAGKSGKVSVRLKSGRTAEFNSQADADKFKREHPDRVQ